MFLLSSIRSQSIDDFTLDLNRQNNIFAGMANHKEDWESMNTSYCI